MISRNITAARLIELAGRDEDGDAEMLDLVNEFLELLADDDIATDICLVEFDVGREDGRFFPVVNVLHEPHDAAAYDRWATVQ